MLSELMRRRSFSSLGFSLLASVDVRPASSLSLRSVPPPLQRLSLYPTREIPTPQREWHFLKIYQQKPCATGAPTKGKQEMVDVALGLVSLIRRFRLGDYKIKRQPLFFFISLKKKKKKRA